MASLSDLFNSNKSINDQLNDINPKDYNFLNKAEAFSIPETSTPPIPVFDQNLLPVNVSVTAQNVQTDVTANPLNFNASFKPPGPTGPTG